MGTNFFIIQRWFFFKTEIILLLLNEGAILHHIILKNMVRENYLKKKKKIRVTCYSETETGEVNIPTNVGSKLWAIAATRASAKSLS